MKQVDSLGYHRTKSHLENLEGDDRTLLLRWTEGKYILKKGGGEAELFQDLM